MESKASSILTSASDATLAKCIVDSYKEIERNYFVKQWKTSELDAGHFVESVRRFLELKLFGKYTPIGKSLAAFNDKTLQDYQNAVGEESYRIHIPRALISIYGIRNKRGVGHISYISPNYLDATFIISSAKWILGELIRINSSLIAEETARIVEHIVDRDVEGIWEQDDITRILIDGLSLKEQILFLLFATKITSESQLLQVIESKDKAYFRKVLKQLHSDRIIEYTKDGWCIISPKGKISAENLILEKINA
jgi:hypothetical protein